MPYLLIVSLIWAFSFGLIGHTLKGVDPYFLAAARLGTALLIFLPCWRPARLPVRGWFALAGIGAVQYGIMYVALFLSYRFLASHEVALFTIFTPLYVTFIHDLLERRFHRLFLGSALMAVAGTALVKYRGFESAALWTGFGIMQISNIAFAFGQVTYRGFMRARPEVRDREVFAALYLGALAAALAASARMTQALPALTARQWITLLYLGAIASGLAFFLWNAGARRVNAGALAVFNNLKIPLAVTVSLVFFGEHADLPRLLAGGLIVLAALGINEFLAARNKP